VKLFKKISKLLFLSLLACLLISIILYFFKPKLIENTAIHILYPKVTIEKKYQNNYAIEIPKMNELMYIACSLTNTFKNDSNLISNRVPKYLKDVNNHFSEYKNHKLVKLLESKLKNNAYTQIQPTIRFFSLNYQINSDNVIVENEIFHVSELLLKLFKDKIFYYPDYLELIEDFAKKTNFNQFYEKNLPFYNKLITKFDKLCDVQGSWDFLEKRFEEKYSSYRIIFSPLTGGFHNTLPNLKDKKTGLQQAWLFVSAPPNLNSLTEEQLELKKSQFTRELFTEMNHNYVNPLSEKFNNRIQKTIKNYKFWNKRKSGYSSKSSTFNEYMTWGIFSLYALENYSEKNSDSIINRHQNFMIKTKKFIHFKEFNTKLIAISKNHKVDSLYFKNIYPDIFNWMENFSSK